MRGGRRARRGAGLAGQGVRRAGRRRAPAATEKVRELQDFVKAEIAPYKYPRVVEFVDALPRTATGKLQRFRLRRGRLRPWTSRPRQLILSLYGLYAREEGDWLSVASLIALMADLGVDSAAVRSSVSRLKRRGVLEAVTAGRPGRLRAVRRRRWSCCARATRGSGPGRGPPPPTAGWCWSSRCRSPSASAGTRCARCSPGSASARRRRASGSRRPRCTTRRVRALDAAGPDGVHRVLPRRLPRRRRRVGADAGVVGPRRAHRAVRRLLSRLAPGRPPPVRAVAGRGVRGVRPDAHRRGGGCPTSTRACRSSTCPRDWPGIEAGELFAAPGRAGCATTRTRTRTGSCMPDECRRTVWMFVHMVREHLHLPRRSPHENSPEGPPTHPCRWSAPGRFEAPSTGGRRDRTDQGPGARPRRRRRTAADPAPPGGRLGQGAHAGFIGSGAPDVDLDASAMHSPTASSSTSRSTTTSRPATARSCTSATTSPAAARATTRSLTVDLTRVYAKIDPIVLPREQLPGPHARMDRNAYCRLVDENDVELVRFTLTGGVPQTGMVMAKLVRGGDALDAPGDR